MKQEEIQLDGIFYNKINIQKIKKDCQPNDTWENAIFYFLNEWFNDRDYVITHTSGSTGIPKEIRLSKNAMRNSARMTNAFFHLNKTKTALLCLPASYIAGKMMLVRAIEGGYNLITKEPKANPFENFEQTIDFTAITPYQLHFSVETLKSKNIGNILVGGGKISSTLEKAVKNLSARFYETYGMTETCSHIALRCLNGANQSDFFTLLEGISIRRNEKGCLAISAPHLLSNEIQTNDIVEISDKKSFKWLGRADLVINSGGIKMNPEQIEKKLENLIPYNFFIGSVADEITGNKIVLIIESTDKSIKSELFVNIKKVLSKYETPKEISFVPQFIYSAGNKILRNDTLKLIFGE